MFGTEKKIALTAVLLVAVAFGISFFYQPIFLSRSFENANSFATIAQATSTQVVKKRVATHIKTPEAVKAVYMSSWVAGTKDFRARLIKLIDETEVNAVVIDIKDYSGKVAFKMDDDSLKEMGVFEVRIPDIEEFIDYLHSKDIYIIGRIAVFQDPHLASKRPDLAVKRSDKTSVWLDRSKLAWIDAGAKDAWDHAVTIGMHAYKMGFDELNYDYIRFPSDGNMDDIYFPFSEGKLKHEVLKEFFGYLRKSFEGTGAVLSADLFGMVTTNKDDLNIGQILEDALPNFDYIAPMVYPSHYPRTFLGYEKPAEKPYEVVHYSMKKAVERAKLASTSPLKLRPWLQDFSLGTKYTADMVRAQIKATYDVGLTSWMLWDPNNRYTRDALLPE